MSFLTDFKNKRTLKALRYLARFPNGERTWDLLIEAGFTGRYLRGGNQ